jgi:hypothetical protein
VDLISPVGKSKNIEYLETESKIVFSKDRKRKKMGKFRSKGIILQPYWKTKDRYLITAGYYSE